MGRLNIFSHAVDAVASIFNFDPPKYANPTHGVGLYGGLGMARFGQLDAMSSVGTLYSIVHQLSQDTAQTDWGLYRKAAGGRRSYGVADENRVEVQRHLALKIWDKPNPYMTRMQFVERTQQYIDLTGESFWLVERAGETAVPEALWPVRPDRMHEVINQGGALIGWIYRAPDGTQIPYKLSEIIPILMPDPTNMYRGMGPVQAIRVDLESVNAAADYNAAYFRNSAAPSGVIQVDHQMTDNEFNRVADQWGERHKGVRNAHRVGILENGAQWVDTTTSMKDMQFVELRNMSRELIREAYAIHPHMLGISDTVNLANAYAADATYAKRLITPRLERIRLALNDQFLPMFGTTGQKVEFCYDNPVPADAEQENAERKSKVDAAVALINAGAEPESALEAMGLPEIEWTEKQSLPSVAPVSPAPAPPTQGDEELTQDDLETVARLLKGVFA